MNPELAVLIPHFNQPNELEKSLSSIKSSKSLLIVIVDDGSSTDKKPTIGLCQNDLLNAGHSIEVIRSKVNLGIEHALNLGLEYIFSIAAIKYIVRLDCGDTNTPDRIDKQYNYMEAHPHVALLGSSVLVEQNNIKKYVVRMPLSANLINKRMFVNNQFIHPAVIIRVSAAKRIGLYPINYPAAEDYAYFFKFTQLYSTANLPDTLLTINKDSNGISLQKRRQQLISRSKVILHNFEFNSYSLWGLIRTLLFLIIPTSLIEFIKRKILK